jgi:hypothetical protein
VVKELNQRDNAGGSTPYSHPGEDKAVNLSSILFAKFKQMMRAQNKAYPLKGLENFKSQVPAISMGKPCQWLSLFVA